MNINKHIYNSICILIVLSLFLSPVYGEYKIHVIDVGYGSAVHVEDEYNHYLFDVGSNESFQKVMTHLSQKLVTRIDAIFLTHTHKDHAGGLLPLVRQLTTLNVFWNEELPLDESVVEDLYKAQKITNFKKLDPGQGMHLSRQVHVQVLNSNLKTDNLNDNSLVFLVSFLKNKILIPGDVGFKRQKDLAQIESENLKKIRWMLWPHHGDELDSNFLNSFEEMINCVISVGKNKYNLPFSGIKTQSKNLCENSFSTDESGTLSFSVGHKKIIRVVEKER